MKFVEPSVQKVFDTFINNDEIIDLFKKERIFVTYSVLYEMYNPNEIKFHIKEAEFRNNELLYSLSRTLLEHNKEISKLKVRDLIESKTGWNDIAYSIGIQPKDMTDKLYKSIMYTYKYCCVSSFFQNNAEAFIPTYDFDRIKSNEAADGFLDAMLKEFDKLNSVLSECSKYLNIDNIPWDTINYFTQLLGFEKSTINATEEIEEKFKELASNILDIYRIKGTNYSFELFFSFLGYSINIKEFYFDRRFYYRPKGNDETEELNKEKYDYYLTSSNPSKNELNGITVSEIVLPNDISPQYSLEEFNDLCNVYGPKAVLGYSPVYYEKVNGKMVAKKYDGKVYKYFKTNLIYYDVSLKNSNLNDKQIKAVIKYLDFLTPSYVTKRMKSDSSSLRLKEDISFNGGGDRNPDEYGEYDGGFQMLDGEDWDDSLKEKYVSYDSEDGEYKCLDESKVDPEGNFIQVRYNNSLSSDSPIKSETNSFRVPIDHKIFNKSLNRLLADGMGGNKLVGSRLKCYKSNNGINVVPFISVPPKAESNLYSSYISGLVYEPMDMKNLIGKESVREGIKKDNSKIKIDFLTDKPIKDFIDEDKNFNTLSYSLVSPKRLYLVETFNNIDDFKKIYKGRNFSNINDIDEFTNESILSLPLYTELNNIHTKPEIYKNLSNNNYTLFKDNYNNIMVYKYRNITITNSMCNQEHEKDYEIYINSLDFSLESVGDMTFDYDNIKVISLPNKKEISNYINKLLLDIKDIYESNRNAHSMWKTPKEINEILFSKTYYSMEDKKIYHSNLSWNSKALYTSRDNVSDPTSVIKNEINNKEFYLINEFASFDKGLYRFNYTNRIPGKLIYSEVDKKLYIVEDINKIVPYDNFYGSVSIEEEGEKKAAYINIYDPSWTGYDEESDREEHILYNNDHKIYWKAGNKVDEVNDAPVTIGRPIKMATDKEYDDNNNNDNDKKISTSIIEGICNSTAENFSSLELYDETIKEVEVPSSLIDDINNINDYGLTQEDEKYFISKPNGLVASVNYFLSGTKRYSDLSNFLVDYYDKAKNNATNLSYRKALLGLATTMNYISNDRLYYIKTNMNWIISSGTGMFKDSLVNYCPKLYKLWTSDPYAADVYNSMLITIDANTDSYFSKYGISDELDSYKLYIEKEFTEEEIKEIKKESESNSDSYYRYNLRTIFFDSLLEDIEKMPENKTTPRDELLGKDSNSLEWYRSYDEEVFKYDKNKEIEMNFALSKSEGGYYYLPYNLDYGLQKYSKDYRGRHNDVYSFFIELINSFTPTLKDDLNSIDNYLKQYYYDKLVELYRESDNSYLEQTSLSIKNSRFNRISPRLYDKFMYSYGTFMTSPNMLNAYTNNGGDNDREIRIPFKVSSLTMDLSRYSYLTLKFSYKDLINGLGFNPSLKIKPSSNIEKNQKDIDNFYNSIFKNIKVSFTYDDNLTTGKRNWSKIRSYYNNKYYDYDSIKEYGDYKTGYMEVTFIDKHSLQREDSIEEIKTFINDGVENSKLSLLKEKEKISGYIVPYCIQQRFTDTLVSYPSSTKWVEKDYTGMTKDFSSFGDDRDVAIECRRDIKSNMTIEHKDGYYIIDSIEAYNNNVDVILNDDGNIILKIKSKASEAAIDYFKKKAVSGDSYDTDVNFVDLGDIRKISLILS